MSPPIRDGSGSSIGSIRLGDGTEISEVRTGAGDVLFSATSIPDSAVHRWKLDDVSTGTVTDSVGSFDGTVNGTTSVSGTFQGGSASQSSSGTSNQYIDLGNLTILDENRTSALSVAFTIDGFTENNSFPRFIGAADGGPANGYSVFYSDATLTVSVEEGDTKFQPSVSFNLADGGKHRVIAGTTAKNNSATVYINNASQSVSLPSSGLPSNPTTHGQNIYLHGNNFNGSLARPTDGIFDDVIIYDKEVDASLAQADYGLQPWS